MLDILPDWITIIGTPISIMLGIWSIVWTGKAKKAAVAAQEAAIAAKNETLNKAKNKNKIEIFSDFFKFLNNVNDKLLPLTTISTEKGIKKQDVLNNINKVINKIQIEPEIFNISEMENYKNNLSSHFNDLKTVCDKDYNPITEHEKKYDEYLQSIKNDLANIIRTIKQQKDKIEL